VLVPNRLYTSPPIERVFFLQKPSTGETMFNGFWESSERIAQRKQKILSGYQPTVEASPAPIEAQEPTEILVQYFNREKKICEKVIPFGMYKSLLNLPANWSLGVNDYLQGFEHE
jgi:hypothetical protein